MDISYFAFGGGLIYAAAGIGYRREFFPPRKRSMFHWGLDYNTIIVPDRLTMPANGFDALEDPKIWYPVSKRGGALVIGLGVILFLLGLASRFSPDDWLSEDLRFVLFLAVLLPGQLAIWVSSYRMAQALVRQRAADTQ